MKCDICDHRLDTVPTLITDSADDDTWRTWMLCAPCNDAVLREIERSPVRTGLRLRIALGMVASERSPQRRAHFWDERFWDQMTDQDVSRLLVWIFMVAFVVHALAFVAIAVYVQFWH